MCVVCTVRRDALKNMELRMQALATQRVASETFLAFDLDGSGEVDFSEFCMVVTTALSEYPVSLMQLHM